MKFIKHLCIITSSLIALFLLVPAILFAVLHYWILTPEYLTSTIKDAVNEYTHLKFDCKSVELDYMSSWPSISIAINEGNISLPTSLDSTTTKGDINFKKLYGEVQFRKLLTDKSIQIEGIFLENPQATVALGTQMPPILKNKDERTVSNTKINFSMNQIHAQKIGFNIRHISKDDQIVIQDANIGIEGDLASQNPSFKATISCPQIGGKTITDILGEDVSFSLQTECHGTEFFNNISLSNTSFQINQFPFRLDGSIYNLKQKNKTTADLTFKLLASRLDEIIESIPSYLIPEKSNYAITGTTTLEGNIKGNISASQKPDFKLKCQIDKGSFLKKDIKKGIDTISLCMDISYMNNHPDSCYVRLQDTKIKGLNSFIELQSHISNLQESPFITADLKGYIDFDHIGKEFVSTEIARLNGKLNSDLSVAFNLKDFQEQNLNRIWISGTFDAPNVKVQSTKHNVDIFIRNTKANIGYKKNRSDFIKGDEVLSATLNIDTMKVQYDQSIYLNLSKLNLRSNTALNRNINAPVPITAHLDCAELQAQLNKEQWISSQGMKITAGSKSIAINPKNEAACIIQADEFQYLDTKRQNAASLNNSEFIVELHPGNNNKWDFKGLINLHEGQFYTSEYPIDIRARKARIGFKNNQISFNHIQMNIGKSDCLLSGVLTANENTPKMEGTLHVLAEYIDYNQLKETLLYKEAAHKEFNVSNMQNFQIGELAHVIENSRNTSVKTEPFFIPEDVMLELNLNINQMNYEQIDLHQVNGNILLKDQKAYTNLSTRTNLGKAAITALYESTNKEKPQIKFDLKLQDVLIAQIHSTIPAIETLFPMSASMDGLANCHLTLSSQLDGQMMPIIATTEAICSFEGQNLTLMDHKVFQEIAKKLKFKNRGRNVINQLSANFILKNNQIEVIPFQIKWDRYEAVVGGTHTTDFTYDYHISLLKSPIIFDLGLNLSGKTDEMHYKLGKCKYKDLYKDKGIKHKQKTDERLKNKRQEINKYIKL